MPSTSAIINNVNLWWEYVDSDRLTSEDEFSEMAEAEKIKTMRDCGFEIDDTVACDKCGQRPDWRTCDTCGTAGWIVDCGHKAQPRPICGDVESGKTICDTCYEARNKKQISAAAAAMGRKSGKVRTEAKAAASRANGAKGGRPGKTAKLLCWAKSGGSMRRDEANDVVEVLVPQSKALAVARSIDECGNALGYSDKNLAAGHGVTIVYESGKTRQVRA